MIFQNLHLAIKASIFGASFAFTHLAFAQSTPMPDLGQQSAIEKATVDKATVYEATVDGAFTELATDHTLGDKTAPITMIIYASITCPHCSHWFTGVWPDLKANYVDKGKVRVVFREFITAPAQLAYLGFQLANCAPEEDFFTLIEHQMREQENTIQGVNDGNGKKVFLAIAKLAGLEDEQEMNACFNNAEGRERLQRIAQLAQDGKINSVPSFIINGSPYKENADYLPLSKVFESLSTQQFTPMPKP